jgi:glutamate-1-semialdehyde 2,1-aminomutase
VSTLSPGAGQRLYAHARERIPGGTQLLSKRPEMLLPGLWPSYFSKASGAEVWDLDGRRYLDMCYSGVGSVILGYADPDVNAAVVRAVEAGSMCTLNCPEEVELADLLVELHPWAEMVRYARCGGEALAIAVRIARARTGRDVIAFCGYHGWQDWYLAANLGSGDLLNGHLLPGLQPAGVPAGLAGTALPFHFNAPEELEAIVSGQGGRLAAIVMEPQRGSPPAPGFLERVRELASSSGAVLIFDEVTAGFRLTTGGIHLTMGVAPDVAVFAKAISNGFPMAAVIGRGDVMEAAQETFISSTYWTERIGPCAALATIRKHLALRAADHLVAVGTQIQEGWRRAAEKHGLAIAVEGMPPLARFAFRYPDAQAIRTLFTQIMLDRGLLASNAFYAMYAHCAAHVQEYLEAVDCAFGEIGEAIRAGRVAEKLRGPVAHAGFYRLA